MTRVAVQAAIARAWIGAGRTGALVRVTDTAGLGPRPTDELLLVGGDGHTEGTLLGGTLDTTLIDAAQDLLRGDDALTTLELDVGEDDAERAGLTCGGHVNVLIQRLDRVPRAASSSGSALGTRRSWSRPGIPCRGWSWSGRRP